MESAVGKLFRLMMAEKQPGQGPGSSAKDDFPEALVRRGNNWTHVHSFLGIWMRLPLHKFEKFCYINYRTPPPHPIDPAVMFDLLKILRLVEEAGKLVSKAEAGEDSPFGPSIRLGPRQKLHIREEACHCLRKAYQIDENACAAAMIIGTHVDGVAAQVLRQKPKSADAQYVHLFHEQVSNKQQQVTPKCLEMLTPSLGLGHVSETLRTRAAVNALLGNEREAIADLTSAIARSRHMANQNQLPSEPLGRKSPLEPVPEDQMPGGLSNQLLFQRGYLYLQIACQHISSSFGPEIDPAAPADQNEASLLKRIASQKLVKENAKNAMQNLTAFLRSLQYSPDWPIEASHDLAAFISAVFVASNPRRIPTLVWGCSAATNVLYPVSQLFSSVPIAELQPYPPLAAFPDEQSSAAADTVKAFSDQVKEPSKGCESVTYHPYLPEALHALLLCHCLMQTSKKEIRRHAYMVARLVRLCDGFPAFAQPRSASRDDWKELLGYPASDTQLLPLVASWDDLCSPKYAPLLTELSPRNIASAAEGAQPASGNMFDSAIRQSPSHVMQKLLSLAKARARNQPPNSEMPMSDILALPGCRINDNAVTDGLPDDTLNLRTGRACHIRRWLKENPVVPTVPRKKKSASKGSTSGDGKKPKVTVTEMK